MPSKQRQNPSSDRVMSADSLREVGFDANGDVIHAYEVRGSQAPQGQQSTGRRR